MFYEGKIINRNKCFWGIERDKDWEIFFGFENIEVMVDVENRIFSRMVE